MRSNQRGFTLVELLSVIVILAVLGLILGGLFRSCSRESTKEAATEAAKGWAAEMQIQNPRVSCAAQDSDGDGYVSCTIGHKLENGDIKTTAVECAGSYTFNEGCRLPKAILAH